MLDKHVKNFSVHCFNEIGILTETITLGRKHCPRIIYTCQVYLFLNRIYF